MSSSSEQDRVRELAGRVARRLEDGSREQAVAGGAGGGELAAVRASLAEIQRRLTHIESHIAHGEDCDDFPLPEHPAEFHPFFGKYAATGKAITTTPYGSQDGTTTDQSGGTGTDQHFDPRYYEQTPQNPPDVQAPPAQPPTEGAPQGQGQQDGAGPGQ